MKVPRNEDGIADNHWEHSIRYCGDPYNGKKGRRARCRLIPNTFLLVMEYVEPAWSEDIKAKLGEIPAWVGAIDCGQVGFDRKGNLKAYDYGIS